MQRYQLPAGSAERIANADIDLFMRIEELDLRPREAECVDSYART